MRNVLIHNVGSVEILEDNTVKLDNCNLGAGIPTDITFTPNAVRRLLIGLKPIIDEGEFCFVEKKS